MKRNVLSVAVLIPCPLAARCRCQVTGCASSLRSSYLSRWGAPLPRPLVPALRKREGFGGEKAATCAASLPVPTNLNISFILRKPSRLCQCSASGKSEQKREVAFPQKSGKATSRYCGSSFSAERPLLRLSTVPYPAPAPCRTQGARGAADTPPASRRIRPITARFTLIELLVVAESRDPHGRFRPRRQSDQLTEHPGGDRSRRLAPEVLSALPVNGARACGMPPEKSYGIS